MRHQKSRRRLIQKPAHAKMMERNLLTSLLLYETIRTTKSRAKVIQPMVDRLVGYAKKHQPHVAIRMINKVVTDKNASRKIMEVYKDRYAKRDSGLTSMKAAGARQGDGARLVDLTLMDAVIGEAPEAPKKKEKAPKEVPATT